MYTPEKHGQKTQADQVCSSKNSEVEIQLDAMFNQLETLELTSNRLFDRINLIMKPSTYPEEPIKKDEQSNEREIISPLTERLLSYNRRIYRVISDIESVIDRIEL